MKVLFIILGFIELGIVAFHFIKGWNTTDPTAAAERLVIIFVNLMCAMAYFLLATDF